MIPNSSIDPTSLGIRSCAADGTSVVNSDFDEERHELTKEGSEFMLDSNFELHFFLSAAAWWTDWRLDC
jgi:hypothetical protein